MQGNRFKPGDRVKVLKAFPPGHIRTPYYVRGCVGEIERICGAFANPEELALMRRAAALTADGHRAAMALARPGVREYQIEAELLHIWRSAGSTGPGYEPIVAAGVNGTVLHYHSNNDLLRDGETVLLDAGCEWRYYTADVTRTFPVSGTFSSAQRDLYAAVLRAQRSAIVTGTARLR